MPLFLDSPSSLDTKSSPMGRSSPTLGQLFNHTGDTATAIAGEHHVLELHDLIGPKIPYLLAFSDLTYSVKNTSKRHLRASRTDPVSSDMVSDHKKVLLNSISGEAKDGEILAVLGASGSGKSTLIDALANRISKDSLKGLIKLNGESLESKQLKMISAYVMQDDLLYPMLTVKETLIFSAEFRLPRSMSRSKKRSRVQALIDQLDLRRAANTIIGDEGHRGVSGGERRRVSIGIDIIHDPIVLFLDEPTSGLDSTSAFMVVKVLQRIAQSGSIVVMSIHQPSYRIVGLLDRLLLLSRGQAVFFGSSSSLTLYMAEFGRPIPENENPTEFALDLIRELESGGSDSAGIKPLVEFYNLRRRLRISSDSTFGKQNCYTMSLKDSINASISRGKLGSASVSRFANPFWIEMAVLSKRAWTNSRRMPELFAIRLGAVVVTGFILATIFWRLDSSPKGVQERLGFFAIAMSTMFYTCADALPVFMQERYIFMRETAYNAYRRSSYVLSNAIVGFPSLVVLSAAFTAITFFAVGLSGGAQGFFFFFLIVLASFWAGSGFVTFLSGIVSHVMIGYTVVVAILAYFLLFSGFFITRDRIPDYWIWFHYLSLVKYPYEAVLQNEFSDASKCFVRGVQMFDNSPLGRLPAAVKVNVLQAMSGSLGVSMTNQTCIMTGIDILKQQGVTELSKWGCLLVTFAWGFIFRMLFYVSLLAGSRNKRR